MDHPLKNKSAAVPFLLRQNNLQMFGLLKWRQIAIVLFLVIICGRSDAATYYVSQSGSGLANGSSAANAWSVATFNSITSTAGGDFVIFDGTITSTVAPADSGAAGNPIVLDFSKASLNTADPRIRISGRSNLTLLGGTFGSASGGSLISFSSVKSSNIVIDGWSHTGTSTSTCGFVSAYYCDNLTIQKCTMDSVRNLVSTDSTQSSNFVIRNNVCRTSVNTTDQTDIVFLGDMKNCLIEGNKFVQRAPGDISVRHNDILQCYQKGGSYAGAPTEWTIRYNWLELDVIGGSGDNSWLMLEMMTGPCKIYGNVFVGRSGTAGNNGVCNTINTSSAVFYFYNNTVIRNGGPDNCIRFLSPGTLYARNNVGYAPSGGGGTYVAWTMTEGGGTTGFDYNYFYNWGTQSNAAGTHGSSSTNPNFTSASNYDFSLGSSSVLRGAGDNTIGSEYNQGIAYGATWPNPTLVPRSSVWDVGAFQQGSVTPDTKPPVISSVSVNPTSNSATVTWLTDEPSTSEVNYGSTVTDSAMVTSHAISITGLSPSTTYQYTVLSADAAGNRTGSATLTFTTAPAAAQIAVTPASLSFGYVAIGQTKDSTLRVSNTGAAPLVGTATVSAPFSVASGGSYNIAPGQSQDVVIRFSPTAEGLNTKSVAFTGGGGTSVSTNGTGLAVLSGLTFEAEAGTITAPFSVAGGAISQSVETGLSGGGRASYLFTVSAPGEYAVMARVKSPSLAENSIFINIDGEPQDPTMVWDLPVNADFTSILASGRGSGTPEQNEFTPRYFVLTAGTHELILRGREANVTVDSLSIVKRPSPPNALRLQAGQ